MNKKFIQLWVPVFTWAGLIFYLSSIPNLQTDLGLWDTILRKLAHLSEYLVLTFLLYRAFRGSFGLSGKRLILYPSLTSFLYAILDEFHQTFIPSRCGSLIDVFIDACGIAAFYILLFWFSGPGIKKDPGNG